MTTIHKTLIALLTLLVLLLGCSNADDTSDADDTQDDEAIRIVGTTTQAGDIVRILTEGTDGLEATGLMGAGVDPHLYQPTEDDIAAMNVADIVVYSGLHLEGQFDQVFEALRERGVVVHALSDPVKDGGFVVAAFDEGPDGGDDPHFWFDPRNWAVSVEDLAEVLAESAPEQADTIRANADSYLAQLELLFAWAEEGMTSVPEAQRYLVTSHDAFQYFGAAFGWQMAAIQGISTEDEAGVGDIQETVDFVIGNGIPVLFVESSIPPDTIEAVIEAIAADGGAARLGVRELFGDAMGSPNTFGGTFVGMIAQNVYTILQSYDAAGAEVVIPQWPEDLLPAPPAAILNVSESE